MLIAMEMGGSANHDDPLGLEIHRVGNSVGCYMDTDTLFWRKASMTMDPGGRASRAVLL